MSEEIEKTLKELKEQINLIDRKIDALIKKVGAKFNTDYKHKGISAEISGGPIWKA